MNIEVYKRQVYIQTNSVVPVPYSNTPYQALAVVNLTAVDSVDSASVNLPSGSVLDLDYWYESHYFPPHWQLLERDDFPSKAGMDAVWGNGEYRFTTATVNDGQRSVPVSLTGDTYPNVPRIQNFDEAQSVVASKDFVLKWDAFSGGTTNDIILCSVFDLENQVPAFGTALPHDPAHFNGTATQVIIPAGTLEPDSVYACELWFAKVTSRNTTSYPGVLAGAAYVRATLFYLNTTSAVTNAQPRFTKMVHNADGSLSVTLTGEVPMWVKVEVSTDLVNWLPKWAWPEWTYLGANDKLNFKENPQSYPCRFFRATVKQ